MKDLGYLSYFLGLEITHSTDEHYITQVKYAFELLSLLGLTDSKTIDTSVELNAHLTPSRGNHYLILLFTNTVTSPDISYVVHQVSYYLFASQSTHYVAILRILRYLKGIFFHGLFYSTHSPLVLRDSLMLIGQEIPLIAGPPLVIAFFLVIL